MFAMPDHYSPAFVLMFCAASIVAVIVGFAVIGWLHRNWTNSDDPLRLRDRLLVFFTVNSARLRLSKFIVVARTKILSMLS